jgi:hypothetical protein
MYSNQPTGRFGGMGGGLTGPVPRDIWLLLGIVLFTFSLRFFASTAWLPALLELTPLVWQRGFVWQLVTYPFAGAGTPGFWFVIALLILFMFGRDVYLRLGRRNFWTLLLQVAAVAAIAAVIVEVLKRMLFAEALPSSFVLMQGQHMLLVILIAAFATLNGNATILLFFVLPVQAKWFLGLEILFAFLGFLGTRDLPGFLGICVAVGFTWMLLTPGSGRANLREVWLRLQARWIKLRLAWMRKRRGLRVVQGDKGKDDPWVN